MCPPVARIRENSHAGANRRGNDNVLIKMARTYRLSFLRGGTVNALAEHHETLEGKFRGEIQKHIENGHEIAVPQQRFRQIVPQNSGRRGKHQIVAQNLQKSNGNVVDRAEGQLPVQEEVPDNGKRQGN